MKVLLFSSQWPEYVIELANALSKSCTVILMLPSNHRFNEKHKELIQKEVHFIPYSVVFFKSIRENAKMLFLILKILWKYKPDILHIQANGHRLFYWIFLLKPFKTKIINTIHDPVKHLGDQLSHNIDDTTVIFFGKVFTKNYIVHGDYLKNQLINSYKVPAKKVEIIPHGHFEIYKKFQDSIVQQEDNTFLFFGRIWPYKGLEYFIKAANIVLESSNEARFYIAGVGEDIIRYKDLIRRDYINNFIIINERIPLGTAGELFQKANVIVLPYIEATQSGVIPVAYAYGKPVIATNVGSLPEVIIDGVTGFVVEPKNERAIAEKMLYCLRNQDAVEKMGRNAYLFALENLSWEKIASKTIEVYKKVRYS